MMNIYKNICNSPGFVVGDVEVEWGIGTHALLEVTPAFPSFCNLKSCLNHRFFDRLGFWMTQKSVVPNYIKSKGARFPLSIGGW
jgi:hypothetical protein